MIVALVLLLLGSTPGQALPDLTVRIDGVESSLGPISGDDDAFYLDFGKAVDTLSKGHAQLHAHEGFVSIDVDGVERVKVQTGLGKNVATCLDGKGHVVRQIDLLGLPDSNGVGGYWIDAGSLGRLMDVNVELDGASMNVYTPEYWAAQMAIPAERSTGLNLRSIGEGLAFGATPPGRDVVVWLRPTSPGRAQIYAVANAASVPMIGRSATGQTVDFPDPDQSVNLACADNAPLRAISEFARTSASGKEYGVYGCVYSPSMGADADALQSVLDGSLKDWYIAGCRQLKSETSYAFELVTVKGKDGITRIASDYKLPVDFLYEINGYGSSPKISSGDRLLVLSKKQLQPKGPQTTPGPLYETKAGDTLDALAAKWHSTVDDVLSLNSDVLPGQDLDPGSILTEPGGSPETGITVKQEFGDIKDPTYLFKTSNSTQGAVPLEPNTPVVVQCEVPPNFYQVMVVKTGAKGYVVRVHVSLRDQPKRTGTTQLENAVKTEALSHLGTRYLWGGHDLVHGIDCSHYVAAVLSRSVLTPQATPSPPVFLQEQKGLIVHWKATFALRGSSQFVPPAPRPPSANELRPGDRIILQWDPVNGRVGGRHTGIFVGAYGKIKYGVANATCSHGVAVTDLFRPYFWKGYRYALRDFKH